MQFIIAIFSMLFWYVMPAHAADPNDKRTAYDFQFTSIEGSPMPLVNYKGKLLLIVNTASKCGFTGQYADLEQLWQRYGRKGLVVIAVPSNDFGAQEPDNNENIHKFCEGKFNITFPVTEKQVVSGENAHPFYKWITAKMGPASAPKWNFHKILIDIHGQPVASYTSFVKPTAIPMVEAIEAHLPPNYTPPAGQ